MIYQLCIGITDRTQSDCFIESFPTVYSACPMHVYTHVYLHVHALSQVCRSSLAHACRISLHMSKTHLCMLYVLSDAHLYTCHAGALRVCMHGVGRMQPYMWQTRCATTLRGFLCSQCHKDHFRFLASDAKCRRCPLQREGAEKALGSVSEM